MHSANAPDTSRRSSRVPIALPVLVTALGPGPHFSEMCETLVVSAHGCALRSPAKLEAGASIHFHSKEGRQTTAHVIDCQPMNSGSNSWRLAAQLDQPDNFWALQPCPQDWLSPHDSTTWRQIRRKPSAPPAAQPARASAPALVAAAEKVQKSISEDRLNAIIAESLQPLRAELTVRRYTDPTGH